jgi:hypothetical protein
MDQSIKKCYQCNILKGRQCFQKKHDNKDGLNNICRECMKLKRKEWRRTGRYITHMRSLEGLERRPQPYTKEEEEMFLLDN